MINSIVTVQSKSDKLKNGMTGFLGNNIATAYDKIFEFIPNKLGDYIIFDEFYDFYNKERYEEEVPIGKVSTAFYIFDRTLEEIEIHDHTIIKRKQFDNYCLW